MLARTARHAVPRSSRPLVNVFVLGCLCRKQATHPLARRFSSTISVQPTSVDDRVLISLFDQPTLGTKSSPLSPTGLFGHHSITHPQSLISLANATLVRAQLLAKRLLRARESRNELLKVIKNLDRLSDMLCGVIDLAELIRNAHPERVWVESANDAYEMLCESMNVLNTHVELYDVCRPIHQCSMKIHCRCCADSENRTFRSNHRPNPWTRSLSNGSRILA